MSVQAILAHKMRSVLTMLGIIIGIASVVSVVALGRGSQEKIIANISSMGTNTINVYPGQGFGDRKSDKVKTLTVADSDVLGKQSYIDSATPNTTAAGTLVYRNITVNAQLSGVGEQYFDVKGSSPPKAGSSTGTTYGRTIPTWSSTTTPGRSCSRTAATRWGRCSCSTDSRWKSSPWPKSRIPCSAPPTRSTCGPPTPRS